MVAWKHLWKINSNSSFAIISVELGERYSNSKTLGNDNGCTMWFRLGCLIPQKIFENQELIR
jgi:hypothetical protein